MHDLWIGCNISSFTMTKSNMKKRSLNSKKEHPGCMGGFFSFLDFNQHGSARKLISDKSHADGVAGSRNSLDVASESLETPESRDVKNENQVCAYDPRKNASTKKNAGGLPIKTLIAEEMSKELELKQRTPGVVARLMGLEAMPAESVLRDHSQELVGDPQKCMFGKQQQQPKSTRDGCSSPPRTRVSGIKSTQEIFFPVSQQKTVNSRDQRALPCTRAQLHEKQRQELKKEFGALQAIKSQDFPIAQRLDELNMQSVEKHMLVDETLDEAKMALVRQKFIDAKNLATDEKQQQSKEFFDALGVLQSNKDLFLKFLKEPNSLFSKHLQDLQSTLQTPEAKKTNIKSAIMKTGRELKMEGTGHGNYSAEYNKHDKLHQKKKKGPRFLTGHDEEWRVRSSSSGTKDQSTQNFTANAPGKNDFCSLPTRIVVLKPGPGSGQSVRSQSPPSWSPQSQAAFRNVGEGDRASNRDFIQEVRERLMLGLKENRRDDCKITQDGHRGQIHDGVSAPREIARDIARQVRETVTIDLPSGHSEVEKVSTSFTNFISKRISLDESIMSSGELDLSNETPVMKDSLDFTKRPSAPASHPSKSDAVESAISKEAKKRLSQRLKLSHVDEGKQESSGNSSTLGKMLALKEKKNLNRGPNKSKHNAINDGECQQSSRQDTHEFGMDCTYHRDGDENTHVLSESCAKSHVIAHSNEGNEDMQGRISNVMRDDAHEMLVDSSSLTGSFLLMGGRFNNMKSNSLKETVTNLQVHLDVVCDTPKEVHVDLDSCKGMVEDINSLEGEGSHKQSIDTPYMESKQFKLSCDIDSDASPTDNNDCEKMILQPSGFCASFLSDTLQSEDQTDCATKVANPEQPTVCSPAFCSPTKQSPHQEFKASTITNEKAEQPSPVSVLDSPFQEETPSPKGFKEISSDLQELRLRLCLLKFDGSERPTSKVDNVLQEDGIVSEGHVHGEVDIFSERTCNSPSEAIITPASQLPIAENLDFQFLEVDDISCPKDRRSALCYVRDVLVISGFIGDDIFAKWHLVNHPLDPSLFEKIEILHRYDSVVGKTEAQESKWERHLLFDSVNDVLLQIFGPFLNQHPWSKDYKLSIRQKPAGKQLLRDTWARINHDLNTHAESGETLESILAKDMAKGGQWMELQNAIEAVGCQVERAIFSDLIDEAIFDLVL